jgi:hypothetical protein
MGGTNKSLLFRDPQHLLRCDAYLQQKLKLEVMMTQYTTKKIILSQVYMVAAIFRPWE